MTETDEVLFDTRGPVGLITLNRPKALNALTLPMIRAMEARLRTWATDDAVRAVVVLGAGDKAFCAGGDVIAIAKEWDGVAELRRDFFREEYVLNHLIHTFPKPYIPLVDGISMGGGVGVSVHGSHRVATEKIMFAMPETAIGLFPDVGGGYFLPRLKGETGTYLALTNARLKVADVVAAGVYDVYVPSARIGALVDRLCGDGWPDDRAGSHGHVDAILADFAAHPGEPALAAHQAEIDRCFAYDTVAEILSALRAEGTDFCREAADAIEAKSPLMSAVSLRQLRRGAAMTFDDCMIMEYRLSQACMAGREFFEGVRAMLIDKDRAPKWEPQNLSDVTDEMIEAHFAPLGENDLVLG